MQVPQPWPTPKPMWKQVPQPWPTPKPMWRQVQQQWRTPTPVWKQIQQRSRMPKPKAQWRPAAEPRRGSAASGSARYRSSVHHQVTSKATYRIYYRAALTFRRTLHRLWRATLRAVAVLTCGSQRARRRGPRGTGRRPATRSGPSRSAARTGSPRPGRSSRLRHRPPRTPHGNGRNDGPCLGAAVR